VPVSFILPVGPKDRIVDEWLPALRPGDELIIIPFGRMGDARILGARLARNEYLAFLDADASYPPDYGERVERALSERPGFFARREHPLQAVREALDIMPRLEGGLCVRRGVFLRRVRGFRSAHGRHDVGERFNDLPILGEITFRHGMTRSERVVLSSLLAVAVGLLAYAVGVRATP